MYSKRYKQIIQNDTAANPYSKENLARRLLTYTDDAEKIKVLTGFNEKKQEALREKNSQSIKAFDDLFFIRWSIKIKILIFRSSRNGADLDTAVMEVLALTEERNKRSV